MSEQKHESLGSDEPLSDSGGFGAADSNDADADAIFIQEWVGDQPNPHPYDAAIEKLLLEIVSDTWQALELSESQSSAAALLVRSGLVENRLVLKLTTCDGKAATVAITYRGDQQDFQKLLDQAVAKAIPSWVDDEGAVDFGTAFQETHWRITTEGEIARSDLASGKSHLRSIALLHARTGRDEPALVVEKTEEWEDPPADGIETQAKADAKSANTPQLFPGGVPEGADLIRFLI